MTAAFSTIPAVVLAAGRSRRMGRSKPLLRVGDRTFVAQILHTCAHCGVPAVVVRRPQQSDLAVELQNLRAQGREFLEALNPDPHAEMLDSFAKGIAALQTCPSWDTAVGGALIWPVDAPGAGVCTLNKLVAAARRAPGAVILPQADETCGHPSYLPPAVLHAARAAHAISDRAQRHHHAPQGLRSIMADLKVERIVLPVSDPAVVWNLNTPADLEYLQKHLADVKDPEAR
jgi:CTP:molybdopterin cytidylyltransferase MocA